MTGMIPNAVLLLFALLWSGAGFLYFRYKGNTLAEAGVYGLAAMLMSQSWLTQILLWMGWRSFYLPGLLLMAVAAAGVGYRYRRLALRSVQNLWGFMHRHPVAVAGVLIIWGYIASIWALAAFEPQETIPAKLQAIWAYPGGLYHYGGQSGQPALPVFNHVVFSAPWQPTLAPGLANLSAYMIIALATYALARRYAWPPTAITVALLVISMPRLVHQSLMVSSELLPAAAALAAILALYRMVEYPGGRDLVMLAGTVTFSVSGGQLCYLLPAVLMSLSLLVLGRRHGLGIGWGSVSNRPIHLLVAAALVLVFSQIGSVAANLMHHAPWMGAGVDQDWVYNTDALLGTPANLVRYLLLSIDLPEAFDGFCRWAFGFSLLAALKFFYHWAVTATMGTSGAAATFDWSWGAGGGLCWFGPVGFFLVMPAIAVAFWRGPRRLKTTALALSVYYVLIALILAWQPQNVQWMTPFFVCSGFFISFLLPPWRLGSNGIRLMQVLAVLLIIHTVLA